MPRKPKPIPPSTLKAVAACAAVGFTYHGGAGSLLIAVDDEFYHWVRVRTSRGVTSAVHACRARRSDLAAQLTALPQMIDDAPNRAAIIVELGLVCPAWLCDQDRGAQRGGSRAPLSVAVLELLIELDRGVASWTPGVKGDTVDRLHELTQRGWRPQDTGLLDGYCDQLERWALAAEGLLERRAVVSLDHACPRCESRFAYRRDSSGEHVRVRALRVSDDGCWCQHCGESWGPDQFGWLAQLLGCDPLPT